MKVSPGLLVFFLSFTPIGYGTSSMIPEQELLITSFDSKTPDLAWRVVNDDVMGGRSVSDFELTESVLRFFGQTNTNGGGFASLRTAWMDFRLGSFECLVLKARTDGRTYTVLLRPRNTRISYRIDFSTDPGV